MSSGRPHGLLFGADVGRAVGAGDSGYVGLGAFGTSYPDGLPDLGGSVTFIYHAAPWLDLTTRTLGGYLGGAPGECQHCCRMKIQAAATRSWRNCALGVTLGADDSVARFEVSVCVAEGAV